MTGDVCFQRSTCCVRDVLEMDERPELGPILGEAPPGSVTALVRPRDTRGHDVKTGRVPNELGSEQNKASLVALQPRRGHHFGHGSHGHSEAKRHCQSVSRSEGSDRMQLRHRQSIGAYGGTLPLTRIPQDACDAPRRASAPFRTPRQEPAGVRGAALLTFFVLTVAGCGSSASNSAPAANSTVNSTAMATDAGSATATTPMATATADTVNGASPTSNTPAAVDACTLLSNDEAAQFLGGPVASSGPTSGVGESVCQWADDQGGSIDVSVGSSGTAPGNSFVPENLFGVEPKPVPELDGSGWDLGLGTVDFAAGERHNSVLVVSFASNDTNAQTAVSVAVLVRDRIEAAS